MRIAVFDTHRYDQQALVAANARYRHELVFFDARLTDETVELAAGFDAVCPFVNCRLREPVLARLKVLGVRLVTLRAAGYNGIDIAAATRLGIAVTRVPAYSPHGVAEHAFALLLSLVRKIHRAHARVRELNFSLDGLEGVELFGKTFGCVGVGRIGAAAIGIARGFGCRVLAHDTVPDRALAEKLGFEYVDLNRLLAESDVVSLHVPLTPQSRHLINAAALTRMKPGAFLINTSRGAVVDTGALIKALKQRSLGGVGLDVYEVEEGVFFEDLSNEMVGDDVLARLLTFPNVLITSHQGFLTHEALAAIADTTLANAGAFERGEALLNQVRPSN
jgi:D-lactate dehydrogenase